MVLRRRRAPGRHRRGRRHQQLARRRGVELIPDAGQVIAAEKRSAGFTLVEMLAVVAMFVLMASLVIPNLASNSQRELRREAGLIGSQLELARQRSVVTGIPHRMLIDLDESLYRLEWEGSAEEEEAPAPAPQVGLDGARQLDLSPPREELREFEPLPSRFGRFAKLADEAIFAGVETDGGIADRGQVAIDFDRDGTTDYAIIVIEGADGAKVSLEVLPLADAVRVLDET